MKIPARLLRVLFIVGVVEFLIMEALAALGMPEGLTKSALDTLLLGVVAVPFAFRYSKAERESNNRLVMLNRIDRAMLSRLELSEIAEILLENLVRIMGMEAGVFFLYDGKNRALTSVKGHNFNIADEQACFPVDEFPKLKEVITSGKPVISSSMGEGAPCIRLGASSLMALPLQMEGYLQGVICLYNKTVDHKFKEEDVEFALQVADQANIAIMNARLVKSLQQNDAALTLRNQELSALNAVADIIASTRDMGEMLGRALEKTLSLPFLTVQKKGVIFLKDRKDRDKLNMVAQAGLAPELVKGERQISLGHCLCGQAARSGSVIRSKDCFTDPSHTTQFTGMKGHGHIVLPIKSRDSVLGVMTFYLESDTVVSEAHERLLTAIASQLGVAIENRRLVASLQAGKKEWEETFDAMDELVTIHSPEFTILRANRAAARAAGMTVGEMVGRKCHNVFHGSDEPHTTCPALLMLKDGGSGYRNDISIEGKDYEISVYPVKEGGRLTSFVHVAKDITERKRNQEALEELVRKTREAAELRKSREQLEEINRLKSEFLANMSHELRTPLNAVIGLSQVLLEKVYGDVSVKQAEYLDGINTSGQHLLALIKDILDLSKIEAGKEKLDLADFPASTTIQNSFILVKEKALKHGIELVSEIGPEVGRFHADERRVKQILFNLLSNAIKFTEPGGKVGIRARQDSEELTITVWDTGIGIPDDKKHLLFHPFQMIDSSLSKKQGGTGLGLVLTKRLTEMHGGTITFESKEGEGTSFTVVLPVTGGRPALSEACQAGAGEACPMPLEQVRGRKVMVVEDNRLNMMLAADYLAANGMAVIEAVDGEAALEKVTTERPDLILLDIQMPGLNGFEVLERLKENPVTAKIPVIAMTALAMKGDEERCGQAGFFDYISKPVNLGEMLYKICRCLPGVPVVG